jgi:hypothetical protein
MASWIDEYPAEGHWTPLSSTIRVAAGFPAETGLAIAASNRVAIANALATR